MMLGLTGALVATPAAHAATTTLQVGTAADAVVPDCDTITAAAAPLALRTALCIANNTSGAVEVDVPAGTYTLTDGALQVGTDTGSDITIVGTGNAVVRGDGSHQVMTLDPNLVGGVAVTIDGLTLTGGVDTLYGGGAIIGGSGLEPASGTADALTVKNSTISHNSASADNAPGGGIQFSGGSLDVESTTFTGNSSGQSEGGAIVYQAQGSGTQSLRIAGSTFDGNSAGPSADVSAVGGGAVMVHDLVGGTSMSITDSVFANNTGKGTDASPGEGGAIAVDSGTLTVTGSTFTGNVVTGSGATGAAIASSAAGLVAHYNRITGNTGSAAVAVTAGSAQATENWWGCNAGPGASGCDSVAGIADAADTPFLQLHVTSAPALIQPPATTATITADLRADSAGGAVAPADLGAFDEAAVLWSATGAGAVADASTEFSGGSTSTTFTATAAGAATVTAALDGASVHVPVGLVGPPAFTSGSDAAFVAGTVGTFDVLASGYPTPAIALAPGDALPDGLTLTDRGDGHATITGTASAADAGMHTVTLVASTSAPSASAQQRLTITIATAPTITSADVASFTAGTSGTFDITASGSPAATITRTGSLPAGLHAPETGVGTIEISGTPAAGTGGVYPLQLTASNGTEPDASQTLTLTVNEAPTISSAAAATFTVGQKGSTFTFTASGGYPATARIDSVDGILPSGLSLATSGNDIVLSGTAASGSQGVYPLTVKATNDVASSSQTFTLTVDAAPVVTTQPRPVTTTAGSDVSFSAAADGFPSPTVQWQVSTDGGTHFSDVPQATADTLELTATQSLDGNRYRAVFHNAAGDTTTDVAVLTVGTAPAFTSAGSATFTVGGGTQNAVVTTTGIPAASITATSLPSWVSLTAGAGGSATLTAEPAAGQGGVYGFTLRASNGFGTDATQSFTLTVNEAPAFTSATAAGMTVGASTPFTITTAHAYPALTGITLDGALPDGITFVNDQDGTAQLVGTPASGSGGVYPLTLTTVGGTTDVVQHLTLTVDAAPVITSGTTANFIRGVDGSFTIVTAPSYPMPSLAIGGTLPAGLTFTDNGDGTATISGSTVVEPTTVSVSVTATNGVAPDAVQTLEVAIVPAAAVALPALVPLADQLNGVPSQVAPGQVLHVSGAGFAPFATVTVGFYSTPRVIGSVTADASGAFEAMVTVPDDARGAHTVVAAALAPDGSARYLSGATTVVAPSGGASGSSDGSASGATSSATGGMADTGLPENVPLLALIALLALGTGIAALQRRRRHRRV